MQGITLALAKQIAFIGGNPQDALQAGTFAPGGVSDNTGKGNTCDDANVRADTQWFAVGLIITRRIPSVAFSPRTSWLKTPCLPRSLLLLAAASFRLAWRHRLLQKSMELVRILRSKAVKQQQVKKSSHLPDGLNAESAFSGIDIGACTDFSMVFQAGLDGRGVIKSFEPS